MNQKVGSLPLLGLNSCRHASEQESHITLDRKSLQNEEEKNGMGEKRMWQAMTFLLMSRFLLEKCIKKQTILGGGNMIIEASEKTSGLLQAS